VSNRTFPRIHITIPKSMLEQMTAAQFQHGLSRSGLIQLAVRDWLERNTPSPTMQAIAKMVIDPRKPYRDYLTPDMTSEQMLKLLELYEAAERRK
jgi:metal-responsive CopG/Arc/MetJ family transcriptional regulator